jgi:hypothetical protein
MDDGLREFVRERANDCCEYCRLPEAVSGRLPFHVDRVRAIQHRGTETEENLCYACSKCNLFKGPNPSSYDPLTDELVRLFHPRQDRWEEHFRFDGPIIVGVTAAGRVTAELLQMNSPKRIQLRLAIQDEES